MKEPYIKESLLKKTPATLELALISAKTAALARTARTDLDEACVIRVSDDNEAVRTATNTTATNVNNALVEELNSMRQQINSMQRNQHDLYNQAGRASFSYQQPFNINNNQIGSKQQPRNAYGDQPSTYNNNSNNNRPNNNTTHYRSQPTVNGHNNNYANNISFQENNANSSRPRNSNGMRCLKCGEPGHMARDCSNNHLNYNGKRN